MFQSQELSFSVEDNHPDYQVLKIEHEPNIHPSLMNSVPWPKIQGKKGLIIDGAKPSWLIAFLACTYKNTVQWLATANPRNEEAIVFCSFSPDFPVGFCFPYPTVPIAEVPA